MTSMFLAIINFLLPTHDCDNMSYIIFFVYLDINCEHYDYHCYDVVTRSHSVWWGCIVIVKVTQHLYFLATTVELLFIFRATSLVNFSSSHYSYYCSYTYISFSGHHSYLYTFISWVFLCSRWVFYISYHSISSYLQLQHLLLL